MKTTTYALAAVLALTSAGAATAAIGTLDKVPAATLLLPYFEVNPGDGTSVNSTFSIGNALDSPAVAHVTLWTDLGVPTTSFDVYLTGYDVEYVNLRLLFEGIRPVTADAGADPADRISPHGPVSQDLDVAAASGPCSAGSLYARLSPVAVAALRAAHTGQASTLLGGLCGGADHGDAVVRGFVTVDAVTACTTLLPSDPTYFTTVASFDNRLFGDSWHIDSANNLADADSLVHIEASTTDPLTDGSGDYTFYGRLLGASGADHREGLPTAWMGRISGSAPAGVSTTAFVWRDAWPRAPFACGSPPGGLGQAALVGFDTTGNPSTLPAGAYFPLAAERVELTDTARFPFAPALSFGSVYYDLKLAAAAGPFGVLSQSYVVLGFEALGQFEATVPAWALDNVASPAPTPTP